MNLPNYLSRGFYFVIYLSTCSYLQVAHAALTQGNDINQAVGDDGFNLTIDTDTGLQWLDLTVADGRSFNDVSSNFAVGGDLEGYRHATWDEIFGFWTNAGINYTLNFSNQPDNRSAILSLMDLLGLTGQFFTNGTDNIAGGWYDDTADRPNATSPSMAMLQQFIPDVPGGRCPLVECVGAFRFQEIVFSFDSPQPATGHYLVATIVPLPAAVWLFGSGLIGLIGVARRKKS